MPIDLRRPPHAEALERRRLLDATFDAEADILRITGNISDNRIEFEDVSAAEDGSPSQFIVRQQQGGSLEEVFGPFNAADIRLVEITTSSGNDLIIVGNRVGVAVDVNSGAGSDSISGGRFSDTIVAGNGDDYVFGGGGNDLLTGGAGADTILGGEGDRDTVDYSANSQFQAINVSLDLTANDGTGGENDLVGIDIEQVVGGSGSDVISASTRPVLDIVDGIATVRPPVRFFGGPGNDSLTGADLDQSTVDDAAALAGVLPPTVGDIQDILVGDSGQDLLVGGRGNDVLIDTDAESDQLTGGLGNDTLVGDDNDQLLEGELVLAPGQTSVLTPDDDGDRSQLDDDNLLLVTGTEGDDRIILTVVTRDLGGTRPVNFLQVAVRPVGGVATQREFPLEPGAGGPEDRPTGFAINGLGGDDLIYVAPALVESEDPDDLIVLQGSIEGGDGDDTLFGGEGDDFLDGGEGDNFLFASFGNDTLKAGFGTDYFSGFAGFDRIDYSDRSSAEAIRVGLGALFDDGIYANENDNVRSDIEELVATDGRDLISTEGGAGVQFFGQGGADTLLGSNAADTLVGGLGQDSLFGFNGNDFFIALDGERDDLFGGFGNDDGSFDSFDAIDFGSDG
ncbi:MAG: hypothetical protein AAGI46_08580 [Planctomycetota bacterium]